MKLSFWVSVSLHVIVKVSKGFGAELIGKSLPYMNHKAIQL
jgi:hypothetical protein